MTIDIDTLVRGAYAEGLKPPPRLLPSVWAEACRHLSPEASAEPGPWRNARAPHLVAPMDALSFYHPAERVVCKFSSQSGKTEIALNMIGFSAELDPGPILVIQPNASPMGEAFSKDRVAPMFRDSPSLRKLIGKPGSRAAQATVMHKKFPGGHVTIAGANSPSGLASRPIRYLIGDELDRWEITKEGNPLLLARKRLQTFRVRGNSKELLVSSPTYADIGICAAYDACTQQWERHLVCDACGKTTFPTMENFTPLAEFVCPHCAHRHTEDCQDRLKLNGVWVKVRDEGERSIGFWMSQWTSPFAHWSDTLAEWADAKDAAERQVVTNTVLALPWEGEGDRADPNTLRGRAERWVADVPDGVEFITIGADVQGDRIEAEVVGWSMAGESWSIAYEVLPGEPETGDAFAALDDLWRVKWADKSGNLYSASTLCIDSGAFTKHVYGYVKRCHNPSIIPVKGGSGFQREPVSMDRRARMRRTTRRLHSGSPPEILGVDQLKLQVYRSLARPLLPGTACAHFPVDRSEEYYAQLSGERLQAERVGKARSVQRVWVQQYAHVEALDARVYAFAAALMTDDPVRKRKPPQSLPPTARPKKIRNQSRGGGFASGMDEWLL